MSCFLKKKKKVFEIFFTLFCGIIIAKLLLKTNMDGKLFKVVMLALIGSTVLIMLPHREKILLCGAAFLTPLKIIKYLFQEQVHFIRPVEGFAIWGFDVIFFILFLLWLYRLVVNYTLQINWLLHFTLPFFFIGVLALTGLYTVNEASLAIKLAALWEMFKCWLVVIYLANNIEDRETIYLVVGILLLSGLLQGMIGFGQYITNGPLGLGFLGEKSSLYVSTGEAGLSRAGGTIGHPNKLAIFLGTLLQLSLSSFFTRFPARTHWLVRLMYVVPFLPMLLTLLVSYSRTGWFTFIIGGSVNCSWCLAKKTGNKVFSVLIVFVIFIFFALTVFVAVPSVRNRLLMDDGGAADIRKPTAQIGWNAIYDNQALGVGLNNYASIIHKYDDTFLGASYHFPAVVHNEFQLIAAELGIPAFILFMYILSWILFTLFRISNTKIDPIIPYIAIGFFCGLLAWCIHNQKDYQYVFFTIRFWFYIGVMLSMKLVVEREENMTAGDFEG